MGPISTLSPGQVYVAPIGTPLPGPSGRGRKGIAPGGWRRLAIEKAIKRRKSGTPKGYTEVGWLSDAGFAPPTGRESEPFRYRRRYAPPMPTEPPTPSAWDRALARHCPSCLAGPGEPCFIISPDIQGRTNTAIHALRTMVAG